MGREGESRAGGEQISGRRDLRYSWISRIQGKAHYRETHSYFPLLPIPVP